MTVISAIQSAMKMKLKTDKFLFAVFVVFIVFVVFDVFVLIAFFMLLIIKRDGMGVK